MTVISETQETMEVSLQLSRLPALREFSGHGPGSGNWIRAQRMQWIEETQLRAWEETKAARVHQIGCWRREGCTENPRNQWRIPLNYSAEYSSVHSRESPRQWREPPKRSPGSSTQSRGQSLVPPAKWGGWGEEFPRALGRILRKVLPQ